MDTYKVVKLRPMVPGGKDNTVVQRVGDEAWIGMSFDNTDYQRFLLDWEAGA